MIAPNGRDSWVALLIWNDLSILRSKVATGWLLGSVGVGPGPKPEPIDPKGWWSKADGDRDSGVDG